MPQASGAVPIVIAIVVSAVQNSVVIRLLRPLVYEKCNFTKILEKVSFCKNQVSRLRGAGWVSGVYCSGKYDTNRFFYIWGWSTSSRWRFWSIPVV